MPRARSLSTASRSARCSAAASWFQLRCDDGVDANTSTCAPAPPGSSRRHFGCEPLPPLPNRAKCV